jgi:hypothetical protein
MTIYEITTAQQRELDKKRGPAINSQNSKMEIDDERIAAFHNRKTNLNATGQNKRKNFNNGKQTSTTK